MRDFFAQVLSLLSAFALSTTAEPDCSFKQKLLATLSSGASISCPSSSNFGDLTTHWSDFANGNYTFVVEPATTEDVSAVVSRIALVVTHR